MHDIKDQTRQLALIFPTS